MLFKGLFAQSMIAMLLVILPGASQTPKELRQKYGMPDAERYVVRPGIVITVVFAKDGRACEMMIEPRRSLISSDTPAKLMSPDKVTEIIDEVVPASQRGGLIRDITFSEGCSAIRTADYEQVMISRILPCPSEGASGERAVQIRFKTSECQ